MLSITERIRTFNQRRDSSKIGFKYLAISKNLFRFFRGTAHIYWEDLHAAGLLISSPLVWTCGDLHLENFGSYKADNGLVYFDLNDFDDAILMPAHWELARMLSSIIVAFRSLGIDEQKAEKLSGIFLNAYCETLREGKAVYIERLTATGLVCDFLTQVENRKYKALLDKRVHKSASQMRLMVDDKKHLQLEEDFRLLLITHMQSWLEKDERSPYNYKIIDAAFRIAGTGSLGLQRYVFLLKSSNKNGFKYLLLDMKESIPSSAAPFVEIPQPYFDSPAQRVIQLQMRMQNVSPSLLSTVHFQKKDFIVEELQPESDSINFKLLKGRYRDMCNVIRDMGTLTASAQLRSAGRQGSSITDDLIHFARDDAWRQPLMDYALAASNQTKVYFEEYCKEPAVFPVDEKQLA